MKKYFHELTLNEFEKLVESKMTWEECAIEYPQPEWCEYPGAVNGEMGCWSLMLGNVTGKEFCANCECCSMANKTQIL